MDLNQNIVENIQTRWDTILNEELTMQRVENSFVNIHKMKERAFTQHIQLGMLHRRIVTNKRMCDMGTKESSLCSFLSRNRRNN